MDIRRSTVTSFSTFSQPADPETNQGINDHVQQI